MSIAFDIVGDLIGDALVDLILRPLHWLAWGTGILVVTAVSVGRFQIEPWDDEEEWTPAETGPILTTFGATLIGGGTWTIAIAGLLHAYFN